MASLLGAAADLAAPGSRLLFDFLHDDALAGAPYPGYAACAEVGGRAVGRLGWVPPLASARALHLTTHRSNHPTARPQSVAGKGEAFVSGMAPDAAALAAQVVPLGWRLARLTSPQAMAARELPHLPCSHEQPPLCGYFSYAELERPADEAAVAADT